MEVENVNIKFKILVSNVRFLLLNMPVALLCYLCCFYIYQAKTVSNNKDNQ